MSAPPVEAVTSRAAIQAPSTCCASWRRRCSAPSCGATATSRRPKTRCRRRCSRRRRSGRREGVPDNPRGWLIQVRVAAHDRSRAQRERAAAARGRRRALDRRAGRAAARATSRRRQQDDTLILLFMCCHPALTPLVGDRAHAARGRRPDDGARSRARSWCRRRRWRSGSAAPSRAIKASGVPFSMPTSGERGERLSAVLHVLYLIFNEGYASEQRRDAAADRPVERGDPARARRACSCCRTTPRSPACSR